jgi:hypothetical protein
VTFDQKTKKVRLVAHRIFQPTPDKPLASPEMIDGRYSSISRRRFCRESNRGVPGNFKKA